MSRVLIVSSVLFALLSCTPSQQATLRSNTRSVGNYISKVFTGDSSTTHSATSVSSRNSADEREKEKQAKPVQQVSSPSSASSNEDLSGLFGGK
ncbi:MAG: hypothetical protein KDD64_11955 [Bdellovibrionales bacterium]|nr:hypothetical protein [Bdellovibrionales bacterium]